MLRKFSYICKNIFGNFFRKQDIFDFGYKYKYFSNASSQVAFCEKFLKNHCYYFGHYFPFRKVYSF